MGVRAERVQPEMIFRVEIVNSRRVPDDLLPSTSFLPWKSLQPVGRKGWSQLKEFAGSPGMT